MQTLLARRIIGETASWLRGRPALGRVALQCVPDICTRINVETIGPFYIRLRRNRSFWLRDPLTHERIVFGGLKRLVRPGDVVYDVGANVGLYTRFLVAAFGASRVLAFEPMRSNIELLRKNIAVDPATAACVTVFELALGDSDGQELLQVDDVMSASASLDRVREGRPAEGRQQFGLPPATEQVVVRRLDTLINEAKLPPPDVIKVDIEGAEQLFLSGALDTLAKYRPRLIMEMHDPATTRQVLKTLESQGYSTYGFAPEGSQSVWRATRASDLSETAGIHDLHHVYAAANPELLARAPEPFLG
jgi:FkbM family methyltransferase